MLHYPTNLSVVSATYYEFDAKAESAGTELTKIADYAKPMSAKSWVIDSKDSNLNPAYTGVFPNLDYGRCRYNEMPHQLTAKIKKVTLENI